MYAPYYVAQSTWLNYKRLDKIYNPKKKKNSNRKLLRTAKRIKKKFHYIKKNKNWIIKKVSRTSKPIFMCVCDMIKIINKNIFITHVKKKSENKIKIEPPWICWHFLDLVFFFFFTLRNRKNQKIHKSPQWFGVNMLMNFIGNVNLIAKPC